MSRSTRSRWPRRCRNSRLVHALVLTHALVLAATLAPAASLAQVSRSCLGVQVGSARSYDCINRDLRRRAAQAHGSADTSSLTATAAPNRVGTFNQAATREYLGSSFGHSAIPPPHPHTFAPPFGTSPHP